MTDDQAWVKQYAVDLVRRNVEATNALMAVLKRPKFQHYLRTMAAMKEDAR